MGWEPAALEHFRSHHGIAKCFLRQTGDNIHHLLGTISIISWGTISIISWGRLKTAWSQVLEEFFHQLTTSSSVPQLPWGQLTPLELQGSHHGAGSSQGAAGAALALWRVMP